MALKIFVQCPKRQCNSLFMVITQPWATKWPSLTCINNCKINCSRGDSESHGCFSVFADHREIRSSTSRSITSSGCLLFMQHESCHRGTFSPLKLNRKRLMLERHSLEEKHSFFPRNSFVFLVKEFLCALPKCSRGCGPTSLI